MNIDPRWDHFHNFRQLSPAGISFIQQWDLLDETVRGQAFMYPERLDEAMEEYSYQNEMNQLERLNDHDRFLINLYCSNYNPHELPADLNDIIDQISNMGIDGANNIQLHQNNIENQRAELINYIRRLHSTRNNVDGDSNAGSDVGSMSDMSDMDFDINDIHDQTTFGSFEE